MVLHCIRHGQSEDNAAGRFSRRHEDPLTRQQHIALADLALPQDNYAAIFCSPARRCIETATALGLTGCQLEPRLLERHFGVFSGLTSQECKDRYPDWFLSFQSFDEHFVIPEGESRKMHHSRIASWLEELPSKATILAITHGGVIDYLYRISNGLSQHGGDRIYSSRNASLSKFEQQGTTLSCINYNILL